MDIDLLHTYSPLSEAKEFGRPSYLGHVAGHGVEHMIVLSTDKCKQAEWTCIATICDFPHRWDGSLLGSQDDEVASFSPCS